MSILDIFSSKPAPVAATATPAAQATSADATQTAAPNADATSAKPADVSTTPLDGFTKLWETDDSSTDTTNQSLFGDLDHKKVFEAAKGANFAGAISPEVLQAVAAGGEGATAALQQAINSSTQAAFAQAMIASTKLIEQAITKTNAKNLADLPGLVKRHTAADSLHTENPALSNPAAAPIIAAVQAQLALKHPDATASQLKAMATDYLSNFADVVKPAPKVEAAKPKAGEVDWSTFI